MLLTKFKKETLDKYREYKSQYFTEDFKLIVSKLTLRYRDVHIGDVYNPPGDTIEVWEAKQLAQARAVEEISEEKPSTPETT